jgi:DNA-binding transcriptional MerR regulator
VASHHPIRKLVPPEPVAIPDKLYFRIGDVARLCDVPAYVLRFWETEFPQLKPNKGGTGQRLYRKRDVEMALRIKSLLYDQGYTIPGARQVFKSDAKAKEASDLAPPAIDSAPPSLASEPQPEIDMGAAIRHDAQQRDKLSTLRDELRSLASLLSNSTSDAADLAPPDPDSPESSLATKHKPLRARLVLEPKPQPKSESRSTPHLLNQGDLFPSE